MAEPPRILIAGGSGVFGRLLAREILATTPARLLIGGRNRDRAERTCRELSAMGPAEPLALDLRDPAALARAARGCFAVACAAGPFQELPPGLPRAAVESGAHWLDIADWSGWVLPMLTDGRLDEAARAGGHAVMPGLSTVPTLSGVLAHLCRARLPDATRARATLFIGNRNAKGAGAVASALRAPLDDPVTVDLPVGRRVAVRFDSPDAALMREDLGLAAEFRAAFEWGLAHRAMAAARPLARWLGHERLARLLILLSAPGALFGSEGGGLQVELWNATGARVAAAFVGAGQRMAILPCAVALQALLAGEPALRGVVRPASSLTTDEWIARLGARGLKLEGPRV